MRHMHLLRHLQQNAHVALPAARACGGCTGEGCRKGLSFMTECVQARYRAGLPPVLKGLSFTIESGTTCGVVGRTGSGKSSLLLALFELIDITAGRVLLDGVDVRSVALDFLRSQIAIIPQDPLLFSGVLRACLSCSAAALLAPAARAPHACAASTVLRSVDRTERLRGCKRMQHRQVASKHAQHRGRQQGLVVRCAVGTYAMQRGCACRVAADEPGPVGCQERRRGMGGAEVSAAGRRGGGAGRPAHHDGGGRQQLQRGPAAAALPRTCPAHKRPRARAGRSHRQR
jgi:hypothetical protein